MLRFVLHGCLSLPWVWELWLDFGIKYLFAATFFFEAPLMYIRPRFLDTQWYFLLRYCGTPGSSSSRTP